MAVEWLATFGCTFDDGLKTATTFCVHDNGGVGGTDPAGAGDLADEVDSWLGLKFANCVGSRGIVDVLRVFRIPATFGDDSVGLDKPLARAGGQTSADGQLPREVNLLLALKTETTSRRYQGRVHLPPTYNSDHLTSSGLWDHATGYYTSVNTLKGALLAGHDFDTDNHLSLRVYSRTAHRLDIGDKTKDVETIVIRDEPYWLRSRQSRP